MNERKFHSDVYFMEILEDLILINDNYCGLAFLNSRLEQIHKKEFVDYHQGPKMVAVFDQGQYHDFEWADEYIVKISEDKVSVTGKAGKLFDVFTKQNMFLKGKIMELDSQKQLFLLYALKRDRNTSGIKRIGLNANPPSCFLL